VTALSALLGGAFGAGLVLMVWALSPADDPAGDTSPIEVLVAAHRWPSGWWARADWRAGARRVLTRSGAAVTVAAVVGVWTRWPVGAVLAGIAAYVLPTVLGTDQQARHALARTEAVAVWAEMLRDSLSTAAGLEQTILLTAPFAPTAISEQVGDLAASLRAGRRLPAALEEFSARIDDPIGRLVARALLQAGRRQARQLPDLLSELARRARERANVHLRVAPGHARVRTNARIIVAFTVAMAAGLVVFNRSFLHPYDSALGQLVLLLVGLIFAGGFTGLARLSRRGLPTSTAPPPAPLTPPTHPAASAAAPTSGWLS
jgi:Flp pilus assembly protein TadB